MTRGPHGRLDMIPFGAESRGHGSHTVAQLPKDALAKLLTDPAHRR
jgi:hypothetical protein